MKKLYLFTFLLLFSNAFSQIVNIPDANFKAYLVGNSAINTNADAEIQVSEANNYSAIIDCSNLGINDLTGIEFFSNIVALYCQQNNLTNLDVSNNTLLTNLLCHENNLTNIDLTFNTNLEYLFLYNNFGITNIDVSNAPNLIRLHLANTSLSSVDVSSNLNLENISISGTNISDLELSNQSNLTHLYCYDANLSSLNVQNGNNLNIIHFFSQNNPNLTCILVDDATYSTANWTNVDPASTFVNNQMECNLLSNEDFDRNNFFNVYPNPTASNITISSKLAIDKIEVFNLLGEKVMERNETTFDVKSLKTGIYLLKIFAENKVSVKKFIKE